MVGIGQVITLLIGGTVIAAPIVAIGLVSASPGEAPQAAPVERPAADASGVPQLFKFQQYPKIVVDFEASVEPANVGIIEAAATLAFDNAYNDFQEIIRKQFALNPALAGVTITEWHYHKSTGSVDEAERPPTDDLVFARPLTLNVNSPAVQGIPVQIARAADGVSGYDVTVSFDPGVIAIQNVVFPPQGIPSFTILSPNQVSVSFVDLFNQIDGGSTFENLFIIEVTSFASGVSTIDIDIHQMDDNLGSIMKPKVIQGLIEVR